METSYQRDWMTEEEATAFIGNNASFYLEKWKLHYETSLKGWNWAAMFFGIEWMAYRKMYWEALLSLLIFVGIGMVFNLNEDLWGGVFRILMGVVGNALYRKKALRVLRNIESQDDSRRLEVLLRRGGTSPISVVGIILLELLLGFFAFLLIASSRF